MIKRLSLFGLVIVTASCGTIPKTIYQDKGVGFKVTEDFGITQTETWKHNHATYIKIDCGDYHFYANFSVTWLTKIFNLDKELQGFEETLREAYEKEDPHKKPVFDEVKSTKFGLFEARQIDYCVANDGPRIGSYTAFHCDSLTVIIGQHYTSESQVMTDRCRQMLEETFNCVGPGNKK